MATLQDRAQHTISQLDKEVCVLFFFPPYATYIFSSPINIEEKVA